MGLRASRAARLLSLIAAAPSKYSTKAVDTAHKDEDHAVVQHYQHRADRLGLEFGAGDAAVEDAGEHDEGKYDDQLHPQRRDHHGTAGALA